MRNTELKSKLKNYFACAQLWHHLDSNEFKEKRNNLLLEQNDIEVEILALYGLPHTFYYSEFFQFLGLKKKVDDKHIDDFLQNLQIEAEKYHTKLVLSDLRLLELAQEHQLDIEEVLPELTLRLLPEPYYTYLYFAHLLKGASPADILEELKIIQKYDLSLKLCLLSENKSLLSTPPYQELLGFKLKYMEDFLSEYVQSFDLLSFVKSYHPI